MKEIVPINGDQIEHSVQGCGRPVVILLNGADTHMRTWRKVSEELEENDGTLFRYNRPGIGKSGKPSVAQSGDVSVQTLKELLKKLALSPPYILVGHSIGGLYANLFARWFPDEVSGVVLVDSSHPEQERRMDGHYPLIAKGLSWYIKRFAPLSEIAVMGKTAQLIREAAAFPDVPLTVLSAGRKSPFMSKILFEIHRENQKELVELSSIGRQIIAENSGHYLHVSEPTIVANAIKQVAQQAETV